MFESKIYSIHSTRTALNMRGGFSMKSLLCINRSSRDPTVLPDESLVALMTENIVPEAFSIAVCRLFGSLSVQANKSTAHRSPVPVYAPSMIGESTRHISSLIALSLIVLFDASIVMSFPFLPPISALVIKTSSGPKSCNTLHASLASASVLIVMPVNCSASNLLGVTTFARGRTSLRYIFANSVGQ